MFDIADLVTLADTYGRHAEIEEKTVSSRVFADSKKLSALRTGSDITVGRFNAAMQWFSDNWPEAVDWPEGVVRPETMKEAAE